MSKGIIGIAYTATFAIGVTANQHLGVGAMPPEQAATCLAVYFGTVAGIAVDRQAELAGQTFLVDGEIEILGIDDRQRLCRRKK